MPIDLKAGDIFLTRGNSWLSGAIRFFSRRIGESRTQVNHTGIVVVGGSIASAGSASAQRFGVMIVEARSRVLRHSFWEAYGPPCTDAVAIYRPKNLSDTELATIVAKAEEYVGDRYGYLKIAAHVADWLLLGAYVFRRLARMDKYPICSWVVACAYAKAGKNFGVAPGAATPDDIWDFVTTHPDIYECVHELGVISEQGTGDSGQGTGDSGQGTGDSGQGTGDSGQKEAAENGANIEHSTANIEH